MLVDVAEIRAIAARLGVEPQEMHKAILKPQRTVPRAGRGIGGFRKRSRTIGQQ